MNISGRCESVKAKPVNSRAHLQVEVEGFDVDDLSVLDLIHEIGADKFLDAIGKDECLTHFNVGEEET